MVGYISTLLILNILHHFIGFEHHEKLNYYTNKNEHKHFQSLSP